MQRHSQVSRSSVHVPPGVVGDRKLIVGELLSVPRTSQIPIIMAFHPKVMGIGHYC